MTPLLVLWGCQADPSTVREPGEDEETGTPDECPDGVVCVQSLPYRATHNTREEGQAELQGYSCAPEIDEGGREVVFRVELEEKAWLGVAIDDSAEGVDIDAHLLSEWDADHCLDRGNWDAGAPVGPGVVWVVADTYVADGVELAGAFQIAIDARPMPTVDCGMKSGWMDRVGDGGEPLALPATGPMVLEAHLVTTSDGYGSTNSDPWPESIVENVEAHYAMSEEATHMVMHRDQSWAPQESCEFGQSAFSHKLPVEEEAFYVNMYWSDRPEAGTRMILRDEHGAAVVVAGGFETGPGNLDYVGGTTEEVHGVFGTGHGSVLTLGFAVAEDLPLGPVVCADE